MRTLEGEWAIAEKGRALMGGKTIRLATDERHDVTRVEAFSDGVFAIAITLLVLNIHIPTTEEVGTSGLATALLSQWPVYLAYLSSFITILIMWMGHHNLFRYIVRVDYTFLVLNGLFLLGVTLVPVPTAILARFVESPQAESALSAALYSGMFFYLATLFNVMWICASSGSRLVEGYELPRAAKLRYAFGPLLYLISLGLAFVSVRLSLAIYLILLVYYAWPKNYMRPKVTPPASETVVG
jgi:TMEM175 potassium channel family protein